MLTRTASSAGMRLERELHVMTHSPRPGAPASAAQRTAARLLLVSTRPAGGRTRANNGRGASSSVALRRSHEHCRSRAGGC